MAVLELSSIHVDAERARAFVLAHGGLREKARLGSIFGAVGPDRDVVKALEGLQNPDGGFPLLRQPGDPSSVGTTCDLLFQLKEMPPLGGSPMASRAISFLRRSQQTDGSWGESPAEAADQTAKALYAILTLEPEHIDPVHRGFRFLRQALARDGAQPSAQTLALTWAIACRLLGVDAQEAGWAFEQLSKRTLEAPELAWWLACALESGAGGRFLLPLVRRLIDLAAMQQEDGSWPAAEGFAVESTLSALRVFRGFGVI